MWIFFFKGIVVKDWKIFYKLFVRVYLSGYELLNLENKLFVNVGNFEVMVLSV